MRSIEQTVEWGDPTMGAGRKPAGDVEGVAEQVGDVDGVASME